MSSQRKIILLLAVGVAVILLNYAVPGFARWSWLLIVLVCPISMMFFMHGMHGEHDSREKKHTAERVYACPECGLIYKDAAWAKKCSVWCREHKSCNLEITSHAIK